MKKILIAVAVVGLSCGSCSKHGFVEDAVSAHARQQLVDEEAAWYKAHPGGEVWPGPEKLDPVD